MTPAWILDIFAAAMLVVAAVSAARLVAARAWPGGSSSTDTDIAHLLMGIAMAGTLASSLTTLPDTAWEVIFGLLTAWFASRVLRDAQANGTRALAGGHCAPHMVHSAAMLYMFLALAAPASGGGMSGMGGSGAQTLEYPTLALLFALVLVGYSIWDIDQLSGKRYSGRAVGLSLAGAALPGVPAMAGAKSGPVLSGDAANAATGDSGTAQAQPGEPAAEQAGRGLTQIGAGGGTAAARAVLLSPGMTIGCRIAMGVTMAFMLVIMI
jgi:hypothetical protein